MTFFSYCPDCGARNDQKCYRGYACSAKSIAIDPDQSDGLVARLRRSALAHSSRLDDRDQPTADLLSAAADFIERAAGVQSVTKGP
ncbi:MAG: hypothetical protein P4M15_07315 [Alphaproteobacteria bacterium]|nr:hypothetical protein [Alphaproteobacteria bacterium]